MQLLRVITFVSALSSGVTNTEVQKEHDCKQSSLFAARYVIVITSVPDYKVSFLNPFDRTCRLIAPAFGEDVG